ncbi:class 1 fructose-bisphosphatase [Paraburkholderia terrae]
MNPAQVTLSSFLADHLASRRAAAPGGLHATDAAGLCTVIEAIAQAVEAIAARIAQGAIGAAQTVLHGPTASIHDALSVAANDVMTSMCERSAEIAGMVSPFMQSVRATSAGRYVLFADPLDDAANADSNAALGSIFSIRHAGACTADGGCVITGTKQLAAGYALYGPATLLVITVGRGTHGFTLCRERGEFVLTHEAIRMPEHGVELAINGGNERFWEPPVQRYVSECRDGSAGVRQRDIDTRWIASLVADTHRTLLRGGLCLYPRASRCAPRAARQPLLYQAQALAWLVEQAGDAPAPGACGCSTSRPIRMAVRRCFSARSAKSSASSVTTASTSEARTRRSRRRSSTSARCFVPRRACSACGFMREALQDGVRACRSNIRLSR